MKIAGFICFFCLFSYILYSQNPILLEEEYANGSSGWYWTASLERTYDKKDRLNCEKNSRRENGFLTRLNTTCFDEDGIKIQSIQGFSAKQEGGVYLFKSITDFRKDGRRIRSETLEKEAYSDTFKFKSGSKAEFIGNNVVIYKFLNEERNIIIYGGYTLELYDDENRLIGSIRTRDTNLDYQVLKKRFRITYKDLDNDNLQVLTEKLRCVHFDTCKIYCPEILDTCTVWEMISNKTYDKEGRLIFDGPAKNGTKVKLLSYQYEADKIFYTYELFKVLPNLNDTTLFYRRENVKNKQGQLLYQKTSYWNFLEITVNFYNEEGLIIQSDKTKTEENFGSIDTSSYSIYYNYEFYCDGLVKERLAKQGISESYFQKIIYSYKYPPECSVGLHSEPTIQLFPNPAYHFLKISSELFCENKADIEIVSSIGKKIIQQKNIRSINQVIDVSRLAAGFYFVNIYVANQVFSKRLVVYK